MHDTGNISNYLSEDKKSSKSITSCKTAAAASKDMPSRTDVNHNSASDDSNNLIPRNSSLNELKPSKHIKSKFSLASEQNRMLHDYSNGRDNFYNSPLRIENGSPRSLGPRLGGRTDVEREAALNRAFTWLYAELSVLRAEDRRLVRLLESLEGELQQVRGGFRARSLSDETQIASHHLRPPSSQPGSGDSYAFPLAMGTRPRARTVQTEDTTCQVCSLPAVTACTNNKITGKVRKEL